MILLLMKVLFVPQPVKTIDRQNAVSSTKPLKRALLHGLLARGSFVLTLQYLHAHFVSSQFAMPNDSFSDYALPISVCRICSSYAFFSAHCRRNFACIIEEKRRCVKRSKSKSRERSRLLLILLPCFVPPQLHSPSAP